MEMFEVKLSCGLIRYFDSGQGFPLLLVHGFPLDHSMWQHQLEPLSKSFRLIVPDLPGFGQSLRTQPIVSVKIFADELVELLDFLKLKQVNFCGLSMGGYIGWQFWRYYPERLNRLIACNTRAAADSELVARTRRIGAEEVRSKGVSKLADGMTGRLFATENLSRLTAEVQSIRESMLRANPETVAQSLEAMASRDDATNWLSQIDKPTLFVAGVADVITPSNEIRENANLVPGAALVELSQAGHLSPLENPVAFNQAIETFLG
jgi:pimeloyl-ACP methyl ester carboxylesterase